jgi:hypothetical protein
VNFKLQSAQSVTDSERIDDQRECEDDGVDPDLRVDEEDRDRAIATWNNRFVDNASMAESEEPDRQDTINELALLMGCQVPDKDGVAKSFRKWKYIKARDNIRQSEVDAYIQRNPDVVGRDTFDQVMDSIASAKVKRSDIQAVTDYRNSFANPTGVSYMDDEEILNMLAIKHQQRESVADKRKREQRILEHQTNHVACSVRVEPTSSPYDWKTAARKRHEEYIRRYDAERECNAREMFTTRKKNASGDTVHNKANDGLAMIRRAYTTDEAFMASTSIV